MWIYTCALLLGIGVIPERGEMAGIKVFDFKMTETLSQDYTDSDEVVNELEVDTADGKKTAHLHHKPSLFSEETEVSLCSEETCDDKPVDKDLKTEMEQCTYEGALDADPNSVVTFSQCKGSTNLNLISSKVELTSNTYRKVGNELREHEVTLLSDEIALPAVDANLAAGGIQFGGNDYAAGDSHKCCRIRRKICTYSTPTKQGSKSCKTEHGPVHCGAQKCKKLRLRVEYNMMGKLKEHDKNLNKKVFQGNRTESNEKNVTGIPYKKGEGIDIEKTEENYELSGETEEYAEETTEYSIETKDNKEDSEWQNKALNELDSDDMDKIVQETQDHAKKKSENFRSLVLKVDDCVYQCKEENPKEKKYNERTIELGIVTDKYLWREVQDQMPNDSTDEDVKNQMMRMLHSIFVSTETFMMHPSISKHGGYKLRILGANIWKGDINMHSTKIHQETDQIKFLELFRDYAKETNERNDGNPKSYDMMILLSGAKENLGIGPRSDKGMAYIGVICNVDAVLYSTVSIRNASHVDNIGALIAHEMGHVLGASHDGEQSSNKNSKAYGEQNSCQQNKFIMTPSQSGTITEWSKCSRDYIDEEYERRERDMPNKGNCYYT